LKLREVEEKKREEKRGLQLGKAYYVSSCSSMITPLPQLFKDELESSS
jgi:hypothetical protein